MPSIYQADITKNVEPAKADVNTLIRASEQEAQGAKYGAEATKTMLAAANTLYKEYTKYDISSTTDKEGMTADELSFEYMSRGVAADQAQKELQIAASKEASLTQAWGRSEAEFNQGSTDLMSEGGSGRSDAEQRQFEVGRASVGAVLQQYSSEVERLKAASQGGMSTEEYVSRVSAISRKAIAKYPGLAEQIRQEVGTITGLTGADRWAEMQFVKNQFSNKQPAKVVTAEDLAIKDMAEASKLGTFGTQEDLFILYKNDRPVYDARMMGYKQTLAARTQVAAVQNSIAGLRSESDFSADQVRNSFVAIQQGSLAATVYGPLVMDKEKTMANVLALMAKGENITTNAAAFKTYIDMHVVTMRSAITESHRLGTVAVNEFLANNPNVSDAKRKELLEDQNRMRDVNLAKYADDKGVGLMAMATIMSSYRDKSIKEQSERIDLMIKQVAATSNSSLVQAYWAGGASRERLKVSSPHFYKFMSDTETTLRVAMNSVENGSLVPNSLDTINTLVTASKTSGNAVTTNSTTPTDTTKAVHDVVNNNAVTILGTIVPNSTVTPTEAHQISSALATNIITGANSKTLAQDYKLLGDKIRLLPSSTQATIKANVSLHLAKAVTNIGSLKEGIEKKHNLTLTLGVNDAGHMLAIRPRSILNRPPSRQDAVADSNIKMAIDEFNDKSRAISSNLVVGRAMMTDENLVAIAKEFATLINNRQPYPGFFSLDAQAVDAPAEVKKKDSLVSPTRYGEGMKGASDVVVPKGVDVMSKTERFKDDKAFDKLVIGVKKEEATVNKEVKATETPPLKKVEDIKNSPTEIELVTMYIKNLVANKTYKFLTNPERMVQSYVDGDNKSKEVLKNAARKWWQENYKK